MVSTCPTRTRSGFISPLAWATLAAETPYIRAMKRTVSPDCTRYATNGPLLVAVAPDWSVDKVAAVEEDCVDVVEGVGEAPPGEGADAAVVAAVAAVATGVGAACLTCAPGAGASVAVSTGPLATDGGVPPGVSTPRVARTATVKSGSNPTTGHHHRK